MAELVPGKMLVGEGVCWATAAAAEEFPAEPVPLSEGGAKTEAKAVSAAGNIA